MLCLLTVNTFAQNVGIGITTPNASALLDISSNSKGILIPRMSLAERNGITNPAQGLLIYQTDNTIGFYVNKSTVPSIPNWVLISQGINTWNTDVINPNNIYNINTGNVGIGTSSPTTKLHVSSPADTALLQLDNNTTLANNTNVGMYFKNGSYFTGAVKAIGTGSNVARLGFYTFADANQNNLRERMTILDGGNIGVQGNINPVSPLSFANLVGDKINLFNTDATHNYGLGLQGGLLQIHTNDNTADIVFGSGSSTAFNETVRFKGDGSVGIGTTSTGLGKLTVYDASSGGANYSTIYADFHPSSPTALAAAVRGSIVPPNGNSNGVGVLGYNNGSGYGIYGNSLLGTGIKAQGVTGVEAYGSSSGYGLYASSNNRAVFAENGNGTGYAVYGLGGIGTYGRTNSATGIGVDCFDGNLGVNTLALRTTGKSEFNGNVNIIGTLSKTAGTFKIDHPQDPENKFLIHSFVESPDMMNVYNGTIVTDANGMAKVLLPNYFEAENIDFKYQLTTIGKNFAQAIVYEEIKANLFVIKTDKPNIKVSWMVTGVRNDLYAQKNRIIPEVEKTANEKGKYLIPSLYNQPAEKAINYRPEKK